MGSNAGDINKLQKQLEEWADQLDKLTRLAEQEEPETRQEYYRQIAELRTMYETARTILADFREIQEETGEELKMVLESAWDAMDKTLKTATVSNAIQNQQS